MNLLVFAVQYFQLNIAGYGKSLCYACLSTAGDMYVLKCIISRVATLSNLTILEGVWLDMNNDIITSGSADYTITGDTRTTSTTFISTLTFTRLRTSHGGTYSCSANMTIPGIVTDHQVTRTADVTVASMLHRSI